MIRHVVLVRFRADVPPEARRQLFDAIAALREHLPGITGFESGPNVSPEGLGRGYDDGFVVTFADAAARDAYLVHPEHRSAGARLVAAAEGGLDGILVFDLEVGLHAA